MRFCTKTIAADGEKKQIAAKTDIFGDGITVVSADARSDSSRMKYAKRTFSPSFSQGTSAGALIRAASRRKQLRVPANTPRAETSGTAPEENSCRMRSPCHAPSHSDADAEGTIFAVAHASVPV